MNRRLRWSTRANNQFLEIAGRLEDSRTGAGIQFVDEVERLLQLAKKSPRRFPRIPDDGGEVRRALVQKYAKGPFGRRA